MNLRQNNYSYLLVGLIVLLILAPIAKDLVGWEARSLYAVAFALVLMISLGSLTARRRILRPGIGLAVLGLGLNLLYTVYPSTVLYLAALSFFFVFLLLMVVTALRDISFTDDINWNRIMGAVCVYLLLGTLWALAYAMLYEVSPNSFAGLDAVREAVDVEVFLYFSFVTLTTLGYGDISPAGSTAAALAVFEAVFGQLYIAILIAGLVGAYMGKRNK